MVDVLPSYFVGNVCIAFSISLPKLKLIEKKYKYDFLQQKMRAKHYARELQEKKKIDWY